MSLLDVLIEEVEKRGYYRYLTGDSALDDDGVTFWTCDDWKDWWHDPKTGEVSKTNPDRHVFLMDLVADILGHETGWDSIRHQPKEPS